MSTYVNSKLEGEGDIPFCFYDPINGEFCDETRDLLADFWFYAMFRFGETPIA